MHISQVDSGRQYVGSKCIGRRVCPGPACKWRMLFCYIPPRGAEQCRREIRELMKSIGTQWALSLRKQTAKREKQDYRQLAPQPVLSANSSVQFPQHPSCIWTPSGLRELRGALQLKVFSSDTNTILQVGPQIVGLPFTLRAYLGLGGLGKSWFHSCIHPEGACFPPLVFKGPASFRATSFLLETREG